eukprot:g16729.t1
MAYSDELNHDPGEDARPDALTRSSLLKGAGEAALLAAAGGVGGLVLPGDGAGVVAPAAFAASDDLPAEAYTTIGGSMKTCRILNGMWQLSGSHGFRPEEQPALQAMAKLVNKGYTTFDLADHYGPAEDFVGAFESQQQAEAARGQFFTKWVPRPVKMHRSVVDAGVAQSLARMKTEPLDLLQFHWWDYDAPYYLDALGHLQEMKGRGKIRHVGLTNFDTKHLEIVMDKGIQIASNQVQYSLLDQRPGQRMAQLCKERGVGLLCYGTVLGGLLSEKWIGKPTPSRADFKTVSEMKYYNMIRQWGGWPLFQELLSVTKSVADKHGVSIPNVGVRWVLDRPTVAGAIVGTRLGLTDHSEENRRVFGLKLDDEDLSRIAAVTEQARDLMTVIGDVGDEYRARA